MSDLTWSKLGALFHTALERPLAERDAFLAEACAGDRALRAEVEEMLAAHEGQSRLRVEDRLLRDGDQADPLLGETIGAYRLVELIGRGGMADVYLAERDDDHYEQRVALKLIRPGLPGAKATERFLRERQILAQLEDPNISMLLDGGVMPDGRPYLVMQYVDGEPITDWCRRHEVPLRERLELLRTVCETVQVAHNNLVVHRDLKPANILVTKDGQVRLLDFGIAKLLDEADPGLTVSLDRMLTPNHAAPEQVTGRTVTTATDVYALGILLYELLTDERPFEVDQSSAAAIERSICETTPEPPSQRKAGQGRSLRGELDNIVLMALRKDPRRRYQSARELGEDIDSHLQGRPVRAQGDSLAYRARKALGRHRWAVGVAAVFLVTISISLGVITLESQRRLAERDRALAEQARADAVVGVMSDLLVHSDPRNLPEGGILTRDSFITMLDESVAGLDDQPDVQARLRELMAGVHWAHGRNQEWLEDMEALVAYHRQVGSSEIKIARLQHNLALATIETRGAAAAEPLLRESLQIHRRLLGPDHRDVGVAAQDLAQVLFVTNPAEASELMVQAFSIAEISGAADSLAMARGFNGLGNLALAQRDKASARDHYDRALRLLEPFLGEAHPHVMVVTYNLALTLRQPGELARAESLLRHNRQLKEQVQGSRTKDVAKSWEALGVVLTMQSKHEEALQAFDQAVDIQIEVSGESAWETAGPLVKAGIVLTVSGRPAEALNRFEQVRAMEAARSEAGARPDALLQAFGHGLQVLALYEAGRKDEALGALGNLEELAENPAPAGRAWITAELATVRASVLLAEGRFAEAEVSAQLAETARLKEQSDRQRLLARDRCLLAAALAGTGRVGEARTILAESGELALACGYLTPLQRRLVQAAQAASGP